MWGWIQWPRRCIWISYIFVVFDGVGSVESEDLLVKKADEVSFECMNPLFRSQWHTGELDLAQLEAQPNVHHSLQKCKFWNGNRTCCTPNLEALQQRAFLLHKEKFNFELKMLEEYVSGLIQLSKDEAGTFDFSDSLDQTLLLRAVNSLQVVVKLAEPCMKRLMTYVAGMICFACQPQWSAYVWRNGLGEVVGVNIHPNACIYVDWSCGQFGRAVQNAYFHVMESTLAKRLHLPLPDFTMFFSRVEICRWLRSVVAMHPILSRSVVSVRRLEQDTERHNASATSNENNHSVSTTARSTSTLAFTTAMPNQIESATALPTVMPIPQAPPDATAPALALDPSLDGLKSDFTLI